VNHGLLLATHTGKTPRCIGWQGLSGDVEQGPRVARLVESWLLNSRAVTRTLLTTDADSQLSFHCAEILTIFKSYFVHFSCIFF